MSFWIVSGLLLVRINGCKEFSFPSRKRKKPAGNHESWQEIPKPAGHSQNPEGNSDSLREIRKVERNLLFPMGNVFSFRELLKPKRNSLFPPGICKTRWEFAIPIRFWATKFKWCRQFENDGYKLINEAINLDD